jgi:AhpD family alkylhydroperoxidase
MSYHEHSDSKYGRNIRKGAPDAVKAFMDLDQAALRGEGNPIPVKYAELMAVAIGLTTQCVYCIEAHTKAAVQAGATEEEIAQTTMITAAIRAGGGFAHGYLAMKFFEEESAKHA